MVSVPALAGRGRRFAASLLDPSQASERLRSRDQGVRSLAGAREGLPHPSSPPSAVGSMACEPSPP